MEVIVMALAVGILLAAVGAVTAFAWDPGHNNTYGIDVHAAGVILLVAGIAGVLLALPSMYLIGDRGYLTRRRSTTEVDNGGRVTRRDLLNQM
jgi:nitrate reductase gamma subunit